VLNINCFNTSFEGSKEIGNLKFLCGGDLFKKYNDVSTRYKDKQITIIDVQMFVCEVGHTKMDIQTRKSLEKILKLAYENNSDEIKF
jgi:hypothetical protein